MIFTPTPNRDVHFLIQLIKHTCEALEKPVLSIEDDIPLAQAFRMLENYRYDTFDWRDPHKQETNSERLMREAGQIKIRNAIRAAAKRIFPLSAHPEIAERLELVLSTHHKGNDADLRDAQKFFAAFRHELERPTPV